LSAPIRNRTSRKTTTNRMTSAIVTDRAYTG
jgi:hypothetical protein